MVPTAVFFGSHDQLADSTDVLDLLGVLPPVSHTYIPTARPYN